MLQLYTLNSLSDTSRDGTKLKTREGDPNGNDTNISPGEEGPRYNTAASVAGSVVGTLVFLVIGGAVAAAAVYVVFKYRRRMTETLEPWPDTKRCRKIYTIFLIIFLFFQAAHSSSDSYRYGCSSTQSSMWVFPFCSNWYGYSSLPVNI